jgi:hypothetical protein
VRLVFSLTELCIVANVLRGTGVTKPLSTLLMFPFLRGDVPVIQLHKFFFYSKAKSTYILRGHAVDVTRQGRPIGPLPGTYILLPSGYRFGS